MECHGIKYMMLQVMSLTDVRLAQLDRAFGYGPKGRGFESSNAQAESPVKSRVSEKKALHDGVLFSWLVNIWLTLTIPEFVPG